ncbi:MAG: sulfatase-like hydrolase/transferase [Planctomycetota bacterium]
MRQPNLLITMADDQRRTAWSGAGALAEPVHTPRLAALASRGTTFTRASHAGSPCGAVCVASRAMLHTHCRPFGLPANAVSGQIDPAYIAPDCGRTLGRRLREAGYATLFVGKWHNNESPLIDSFDSGRRVFLGGMASHFQTPLADLDGGAIRPSPLQGVHSTEVFTQAAIETLKSYAKGAFGDRPFCLFVAFTAPHDPRRTHAVWHSRYPHADVQLPNNAWAAHPFDNGESGVRDEMLAPWPRQAEQTRREVADYYAMIEHMDQGIGRIHDELEQLGLERDTVVAHTADHGLAVGQHGLMGKQNLYEHSVGVPLILAGPSVSHNVVNHGLCYQHQLFPTLLELAGADLSDESGAELFRSLAPSLKDPEHPGADAVGCFYRDLQRSVTTSTGKKLIRYAVGKHRWQQTFDLSVDPYETQPQAEADDQHLLTVFSDWLGAAGDPDREKFVDPHARWSVPPTRG